MHQSYVRFACALAIATSVDTASADQAIETQVGHDESATYSHFGSHGLVQMPDARFGEAGDFGIGWVRVAPYRFLTVNVTPFDWLEAAIRYTAQEDRVYAYAQLIGTPQSNKDKGIDAKVRLIEEDVWTPQVAVGIRDLGGTGLFGSEYVVASKRVGAVDVSAGLGWGLLGTRGGLTNPLTWVSDRFDRRTASTGRGGTLATEDWFSGDEVSVFGGFAYRTPIPGLVAKVELDGSDYSADSSRITASSPVNYGLVYRLNSVVDLHAGFERGDTVSAGLVIRTNFSKPAQPVKLDPKPVTPTVSRSNAVLRESLEEYVFDTTAITRGSEQQPMMLEGQFNRYPDDAAGLAIIASEVSPELQGADLVVLDSRYGLTTHGWMIPNETVTQMQARDLDPGEAAKSIKRIDQSSVADASPARELLEPWNASASFAPNLEQSFQSPEAFWIYRLKLSGRAELTYNERTSLLAEGGVSLADNYDQLRLAETSQLPQVRTLVREYLKENRSLQLSRLQATQFAQWGPSVFGQAYVGHLETMFSGYGGEVLYRPLGSWWALGLDVNRVWQRDFDSFAGRQSYAVTTGHVSANFDLPWDGVRVKSSYGRYLAGDTGVTLDVSRAFANGFEIGAWATQTDVSAEVFGEGSFDKGAYLRIPFDVFTLESTRARGAIGWRPMQRDGGQKLARKFDLYEMTRERGRDGNVTNWSGFVR